MDRNIVGVSFHPNVAVVLPYQLRDARKGLFRFPPHRRRAAVKKSDLPEADHQPFRAYVERNLASLDLRRQRLLEFALKRADVRAAHLWAKRSRLSDPPQLFGRLRSRRPAGVSLGGRAEALSLEHAHLVESCLDR